MSHQCRLWGYEVRRYCEMRRVLLQFLDASSHLYKRVCPSVGRSVRPSVRRSVRRSVRNQLFSKSKNEGLSSCISSGKPTNIAEMQNCISIGKYACWSVHRSMLKVKKKVERTHLLVDRTCCFVNYSTLSFVISSFSFLKQYLQRIRDFMNCDNQRNWRFRLELANQVK